MRQVLALCLALSVQAAVPAFGAGEVSFRGAVFEGERLANGARFGAKAWKTSLAEDQKTLNALYLKCAPAVVMIYKNDVKGSGSGFLVDPSGLIVTNAHVAEEAGGLGALATIRFSDKTEATGEVVYIDSPYVNDLALIQLRGTRTNYPVMSLGDSAAVRAGDLAFAFGYPYKMQLSFTQGMINGTDCVKNPQNPSDNCFLQSQTPTNPGNSGGPLVNLEGKVIGVNTQLPALQIRAWTGISLALTVDKLKETLAQYRSKPQRP
jgi:serine protease Do